MKYEKPLKNLPLKLMTYCTTLNSMQMKYLCFYTLFVFGFTISVSGNENKCSQWRGPDRRGVFNEKDLLTQWPEKGPEMLWSYEGLGAGHTSPCIVENKIYISGMPDTIGVLYCFDLNGSLLWTKDYGEEWHVNYTGTRSTPLFSDGLIYLMSGMGEIFCFKATNGDLVWSENILEKFGGKNIQWGITENLLIDGERLICTPGGEENNIVALNKKSGSTIWTTKAHSEQSAYCSPLLFNHNDTRLICTMTASSVVCINADTGEFYWRTDQFQTNKIHANTPIYENGVLYCSSTSSREGNSGLVALKLSNDGKEFEMLWRNEKYQNLMGGNIFLHGILFGSAYRTSKWFSINTATGEEKLLNDELGGGAIIHADGLFYCYSEKGDVALVKMTSESFELKGKFMVPLGTDQHWAHPVIHNKRLYIRHGDALMVYNISAK